MSDAEPVAVQPEPSPPQPAAAALKPPQRSAIEDLARFLYTHNPFYAISAALVFWGLRSSLDTQGPVHTFQTYALMGGLVGYTLILALSAFVVIRFGRVWQDGRGLLLLVVLMFLATSISLDDALTANGRVGTICFAVALAAAVLISEGLLWGVRLRLPALYRVPYYLILGLFFAYPGAVHWLFADIAGPGRAWAVCAFASVAAIVFLTLLPAARRGPAYVENNGSPWGWPLYPWSLFFIVALAVCGRSFYLCASIHQPGGFTTIFAPYFLVPFLLVLGVLLLEIGLAGGARKAVIAALAAPAAVACLAMVPPASALGRQFLATFVETVGCAPPMIAVLGAAVFYLWAAARRVPVALELFCATIGVLAWVRPDTLRPGTGAEPWGFPLVVAGVLLGGLALWRWSSWRALAALGCLLAAATIDLRDTWFVAWCGAAPFHLALVAAMVVGVVFRDPFAQFLRHAVALPIFIAALRTMNDPSLEKEIPALWLALYPGLAAAVALGYGWWTASWLHLAAAIGVGSVWLVRSGVDLYRYLRAFMPGLAYACWGLAALAVALAISLAKALRGRRG